MSLGQWLNSLSAVDHSILFAIFLVGIYFSYATLEFLIEFYDNKKKHSKFRIHFRVTPAALIFFGFNIALGGLYIFSADEGNFPEWISLLHLLIGILTFLSLAGAYLICVVSKREINDE